MPTDVYSFAKSFFRFNNENEKITVVLPHVETRRAFSLQCKNYPLFNYEISPDDAYAAFRVLRLLEAIYDREKYIYAVDNTKYADYEISDSIFIGGPPTNANIHRLTQKGPLRFGKNDEQRTIHGAKDIYWIEFREHSNYGTVKRAFDSLSIEKDYCLISKNAVNNHVQFVIGGLRAYGQRAVYDILDDTRFYQKIKDFLKYPFFRILVLVGVNVYEGRIVEPTEIVEAEGSEVAAAPGPC